jgi:hypothetical protein
MSKAKREPVTIDVEPHELHREPPRAPARHPASAPHMPITAALPTVPLPRPLSTREARELRRLGMLAQQPDFWIGLLIRNFWRG